jgi:hypothetical protein
VQETESPLAKAVFIEVPEEYESLKNVFEKYNDNPLDQFKALCQYRFDKVEEMKGDNVFTIDAQLAYLVELLIVENWQQTKQESLKIIINI